MLDGKDLIVATKEFAKENRLLSWVHTIVALLVIGLCVIGILSNIPFYLKLLCSILLGLTAVRVFVIFHDYLHNAILHKSFMANVIFTVVGIVMLAPKSIWKRSHDYHHKHNSKLFSASIGSYPIMTREKFETADKGERRLYLFIRHPITICFGYIFMFVYGMCINSFLSSPRRHLDSVLALFIHFSFITFLIIIGQWQLLFLLVLLPSFLTFGLGAYLFYAQHNFPGVTFRNNTNWNYVGAALDSSSYMKMNKVMEWFTANIGYHHIHHINARIPFYRLPEAMEKMPELQHPKTTSLRIKDVISCFRLKLWDPSINKMTGI